MVANNVVRCIRHRNDFGAIVLCDPRYSSQPDATASLSKWVRSSVKHCRTVEASLQQVQTFFQQHHTASQSLGTAATNVTPARRPPAPVVGEAVASDCGGVNSARGCKGSGDGCRGATRGDCRRQDPDSAVAISRKGSPGSALVQQTLLQVIPLDGIYLHRNRRTGVLGEYPQTSRYVGHVRHMVMGKSIPCSARLQNYKCHSLCTPTSGCCVPCRHSGPTPFITPRLTNRRTAVLPARKKPLAWPDIRLPHRH